MTRSFRPPLWAWIVTSLLLAVLLWLGSWQIRRAHDKRGLETSYAEASQGEGVPLDSNIAPPGDGHVIAVSVSGRYVPDRQLLLDNQSERGRPGYHVWTPFRLESGTTVVVDRGWIPLEAREMPIDVSPEARQIRGLWRALPRPGLRLETRPAGAPAAYPFIVQYPEVADLAILIGENVLPGVLLLGEREADGFVRAWNPAAGFPPSRHYAYAAQWFALAATLLVLFVRINLKRTR